MLVASDVLALIENFIKFGIAIAARIAMIATTIISSISEKPADLDLIIESYLRRLIV